MRTLREILRNKKAFSAVIASLILMLLAVAAGVVVYGYVMGWIGGATQNPGTTGKLQFDSIYAKTSDSKIKMYVRNIGGKDLLLAKIYVDGVQKANNTEISDEDGVTISVLTVKYLEANQTMTKGYFYTVAVTCKDGTTVSQSVEAK
jgi:ribosomal protein L7/L12